MAEPGGGGGGGSNVSEGANGVPSTLRSALDKIVIKENDDEEKGKEMNGGKCKTDNTNNGGVSNGDCVIGETGEDSGSAQPESPGADKGNKPGLPRRSSIIKDGTKQKRERKKTVSFSSMPAEKKISSASDCINAMVEGSELKKVRSISRIYHRYFLLDADMQSLRWEPSKKDSEKAKIDIKSVKEVRSGKNTDIFRSNGIYDQISEDCAFSIIYGDNYESLDLVANSADVANIWVTGLRYLISYGKHTLDMIESFHDNMRASWLSDMFREVDEANVGQVPLCKAVQSIKSLNPGLKNLKIELKFKELQKTKDKTSTDVTKDEFIEVFHELCTRPEIYFLLVQFSSNKEYLDTKDLMMFLEAEQGVAHVTEDISLDIIKRFEPSKGKEKGSLSLDGFTNYLMSADCCIFDPEHKSVCQDMTQTLSHYYINSSHNTYLIEDQFRGPSDITGYIRALKMGCRSVEIDVWDGPDNEPVIYTGHTMTSQIVFRSVIDIINKYAFHASEYPLILCFENHCSIKQQKVMVLHMKKILGDKLYTTSPNVDESYLPSPESLKGKVLIKGKKLSSDCSGVEGDVTDEDEGMEMSQKVGKEGEEQQNVVTVKRIQISKELSDLVSICKSVQFTDFQLSFQNQKYWEVCSFNEVVANKYANDNAGDFVNYNKRYLSRIFPSPMRIDSSNMNPQDFWKCGCQIVAMNFQTPGLMMDLNIGWFRQNGNCGFVLRPAIMREEVSFFSANTKDSVPGVSPQLLHIKIISGQNFPKPKGSGSKGDVVDPYVYVEIHGIPADCAEQRTKTVQQNGDNPIFDESFEFQVNLPELTMVRFVVLDDDYIGDEFIGQYTIPFECLQPGYRHIPLQSLTGDILTHASLFVHVAITNRRGGGKPHKRGLSVRKAKKSRDYASMRTLWIKSIDEVFKSAIQPIRDATDLRENMQNAVVSFKELCGLSPVANLMQCIMALSTRLTGPENTPVVVMNLTDQYPTMELQGLVPEVMKKILNAYDLIIQSSKALIENADGVYEKIAQCQKTAMEFHENLNATGAKEGLKERKMIKAVESFTWNITILKGQADLLKYAKTETTENLKQIHYAALSCGLNKSSTGNSEVGKPRRSLEVIPEKTGDETGD